MFVCVFVHILYECLQNEETQYSFNTYFFGQELSSETTVLFLYLQLLFIFFKLSTEILIQERNWERTGNMKRKYAFPNTDKAYQRADMVCILFCRFLKIYYRATQCTFNVMISLYYAVLEQNLGQLCMLITCARSQDRQLSQLEKY